MLVMLLVVVRIGNKTHRVTGPIPIGDFDAEKSNLIKYIYIPFLFLYRKFAENIGIKFYTPEEFFDNAKPVPYSYGDFNPKNLPRDGLYFNNFRNNITSFIQ